MQEKTMVRRQFVKVLTAAGLSAFLAKNLLDQAMAQSKGIGDLDILNLALTAEYLATDFYTRALMVPFPGQIRPYLAEALRHEEAHVQALRDTITGAFRANPVPRPQFTYGDLRFDAASRLKVLETLIALETAFTGAYLGAIPLIQNKAVLSAAASIAMNEEAHLALARDAMLELGGQVEGPQTPVGRAFAKAITPEEATRAVQGFIRQ
ncbi:ferritin-like domain-containing protein [Thermus oshimai]